MEEEPPPPYHQQDQHPHQRHQPPKPVHSRFNLYCLQYVFCAIIMWVLIANLILIYVLPPSESGSTVSAGRGREPVEAEAREFAFATLDEVLQRFLEETRKTGLFPSLILIQPEILTQINESAFTWRSFAQRPRRLLTFALLRDSGLPPLEHLAHASDARLFTVDGRHAFFTSQALTIHLVALSREPEETLLSTRLPVLHDASRQLFHSIGLDEAAKDELLFLTESGALPRYALESRESLVDGIGLNLPVSTQLFRRELAYSRRLDCDRDGAAAFLAEHAQEESPEYTRAVRSILAKAMGVMEELAIPAWLSSGTFLGWYRQCGLIPYAGDVDLGVFAADVGDAEALAAAMEDEGFQLKMWLGRPDDSLQLAFFLGDVKLDIYFFYPHPDDPAAFVYNAATKPETGEYFWYSFPRFRLCWAEANSSPAFPKGVGLRVPCPPRPYLEANYGPHWQRPRREWQWQASPPNAMAKGVWTSEQMEETVQVFHHHSPHALKDKEL